MNFLCSDADKTQGELRVVAVGDSFTYGDHVDDDASLPAQLEMQLRARCGQATVVNAGVGGTTLVTHANMVERALPLEPDLVLLTFSENDVSDLATPMWHSLTENRERKSQFPLSLIYPLARRTALWNFALKTRALLIAHEREQRLQGGAEGGDAERVAVSEKVRGADPHAVQANLRAEYAERLDALLYESNTPLVFAVFPSHYGVYDTTRREQIRWVEAMASGLGIPTINLVAALERS